MYNGCDSNAYGALYWTVFPERWQTGSYGILKASVPVRFKKEGTGLVKAKRLQFYTAALCSVKTVSHVQELHFAFYIPSGLRICLVYQNVKPK